jgi:hypothetical protein
MRDTLGDRKVMGFHFRWRGASLGIGLFFGLLATLPGIVHGQLSLQLKINRPEWILYEPIDLEVLIGNQTMQSIDLSMTSGDRPWVEFTILRKDETVQRTSREWMPPATMIGPGEIRDFKVNITPLYKIRESGEYTILAHINHRGRQYPSRPLRVTIVQGSMVWKQSLKLPPRADDPSSDYRARDYSLIVHRTSLGEGLYVRSVDPERSLVYGTHNIGSLVNYHEPSARLDLSGTLHVLHQSGTRVYTYTQFTSEGKLAKARFFSNLSSSPEMVVGDESETLIVGGEEIFKGEKGVDFIPTAPEAMIPSRPDLTDFPAVPDFARDLPSERGLDDKKAKKSSEPEKRRENTPPPAPKIPRLGDPSGTNRDSLLLPDAPPEAGPR